MFGLTDPSKGSRRKKKVRTNLEFTFDDLEQPEVKTQHRPVADSATSDTTRKLDYTQPISKQTHHQQNSTVNPAEKEKTQMDPTSNTRTRSPRPITTDNIKRQKREQATINSLIHGIGLAFTCSILIVAALASLGGYVLYKQLNDQSASLALLEQNTKQRFFEMETDLIKRDTELAKNLEQTNLRLMNMTASFEEFRSQSMEMLADLRATNKTLVKQLNQARQENAEQRMQLARLETNVRLRR